MDPLYEIDDYTEALALAVERSLAESQRVTAHAARIDADAGRVVVRAADRLETVEAAFEALYGAGPDRLESGVQRLADRALLAAIARAVATLCDQTPYQAACDTRRFVIVSAAVWAAHPPKSTWFAAAESIIRDLRQMAADDDEDIRCELRHLAGLAIAWDAAL